MNKHTDTNDTAFVEIVARYRPTLGHRAWLLQRRAARWFYRRNINPVALFGWLAALAIMVAWCVFLGWGIGQIAGATS